MRKILAAVIIVVMLCSTSYAERFSKFPAYGICTGDNVRIRAKPGTKSKILGHLVWRQPVKALSQRTVNGVLWYKVLSDPDSGAECGPFWVAARYIELEQ